MGEPIRISESCKWLDMGFVAHLLDLDHRWPTVELRDHFQRIAAELREISTRARAGRCRSLVKTALSSRSPDALRDASALGALCAHFLATLEGHSSSMRRRRSPIHQTYPTVPWVGASIAKYILTKLRARNDQGRTCLIVDPTSEAGELLIEVLIEFARRRSYGASVQLVAIDKNPLVLGLAKLVLQTAEQCLRSSCVIQSTRFICNEALEGLDAIPSPDAVVSNPPWGLATDAQDRERLSAVEGNYHYVDPYIAFTRAALDSLKAGGAFGLVLPRQALTAANSKRLRSYFIENTTIDYVVELPRAVFPYATVQAALILGTKRPAQASKHVVHVVSYSLAEARGARAKVSTERAPLGQLAMQQTWLFGSASQIPWKLVRRHSIELREVASVFSGLKPYRVGRGQPVQTVALIAKRPYTYDSPQAGTHPVIRGRQVQPYNVLQTSEFIVVGPHLAEPGQHAKFALSPRTFIREICFRDGRVVAAPAPEGTIGRHGVLTVAWAFPFNWILAALMNSAVAQDYVRTQCPGFRRESFNRIGTRDIQSLPIPCRLLENTDVLRLARACGDQSDPQAKQRALNSLERRVQDAYRA